MKPQSQILIAAAYSLLSLQLTACTGQAPSGKENAPPKENKPAKWVGGHCDGCELMYNGMPAQIAATDTSVGWHEAGQKLLVGGTVYRKDGKTPASGVIIYYWHTDTKGYYSPQKEQPEAVKRHGHIRGWMRTDAQGRYALYTIRPAPYPNDSLPAHIHISIKEPGMNEYYIDEWVFDDDALLTQAKRKMLENRGGSGILKVQLKDNLQVAQHDMVLGLNIPDYPL